MVHTFRVSNHLRTFHCPRYSGTTGLVLLFIPWLVPVTADHSSLMPEYDLKIPIQGASQVSQDMVWYIDICRQDLETYDTIFNLC